MNDINTSFHPSEDELNSNRYKAFLKELTALSQKYDIYIQGCGCCGSPWLFDDRIKKSYDNLAYIDDNKGYDVDGL